MRRAGSALSSAVRVRLMMLTTVWAVWRAWLSWSKWLKMADHTATEASISTVTSRKMRHSRVRGAASRKAR